MATKEDGQGLLRSRDVRIENPMYAKSVLATLEQRTAAVKFGPPPGSCVSPQRGYCVKEALWLLVQTVDAGVAPGAKSAA